MINDWKCKQWDEKGPAPPKEEDSQDVAPQGCCASSAGVERVFSAAGIAKHTLFAAYNID